MILHIPHASTHVPPEERPQFLLEDAALDRELLLSTDAFTDELFDFPGALRVVFPVSRLLVDPERFVDDEQEPMVARGRGVLYTSTTGGDILRQSPDPQKRRKLLDAFYHPHHELLAAAVDKELQEHGRSLVVDCHSFPLNPWAVEVSRKTPRPEYCIGTDAYHTPGRLAAAARRFLAARGNEVAVNHPYAGSIVPLRYYGKNPNVQSIMIEVRRDLYMDEATGRKNEGFAAIKSIISELLFHLQNHHHGKPQEL